MSKQALNAKVAAQILKGAVESGLKALGATNVEFQDIVSRAQCPGPVYYQPHHNGRIVASFPSHVKVQIALDAHVVDNVVSRDPEGLVYFARQLVREVVEHRLDQALKETKVEISLADFIPK